MEYIIFFAAMLVLILLFFIKGYCDYRKEEKNFINSLYENYGKMQEREYKPEEFRNISKYYQKHKQDFNIDDITWNDLGMDEVFKKINFTHSAAGEEYLYYTLRTPEKSISSLTHKEEIITAFCSDKDERVRLQFILSKLGRCGKFSIHDYLDYLDELGVRSNTKHYLALLALIFSISVIFVNLPFGLLLLVCVVIFNNITYFREKNNIDPYITSFAYIFRMLDTAQKVQKNKINALTEENSTLELCCKKLDGYKRGSFLLMSAGRMSGSGNPLELLLDFIRMGFHLDLIKFNQMLSQVRLHANDIDQIITVLGKIDSLIAIGEYRESLEHFCIPEFIESTGYEITDAYHPLISNPVKNSICTKNGILITGSNASGKSTFLKTIAINTILAQSIHTCLSSTYKSSLFRICSSMSLRDDVEGGSSYYMVEIKSIKRILDFMTNESELPVLCFVDEVLRGTNTVERIAASTQILKSLSQNSCICFAATHDIELTHLLEENYTNYHFSEEIKDQDILFNYKILNGRATTRNAIKLLGIMGYDNRIISEAESMAEQFLAYGIWKTPNQN